MSAYALAHHAYATIKAFATLCLVASMCHLFALSVKSRQNTKALRLAHWVALACLRLPLLWRSPLALGKARHYSSTRQEALQARLCKPLPHAYARQLSQIRSPSHPVSTTLAHHLPKHDKPRSHNFGPVASQALGPRLLQ